MNSEQKTQLKKIIAALIITSSAVLMGDMDGVPQLLPKIVFIAAYLLVGADILLKAGRNILRGQVFDENFLMAIASLGAMLLSDFAEANTVMIFYQVGELFESYAVSKSRKSISDVMDIRPDYANLLTEGGEAEVDPYTVRVGDIIVVKPGEKIPLDGRIIEGSTSVNTAALTGEAEPRFAEEGEAVVSGCINMTGVVKIEVTKEFEESAASKILELVENSLSKKAKVERFITKFARVYTPFVVLSALIIAVLPPLLALGATFSDWVYRALVFLVISCPCALVISVPLAFFGGLGAASKTGILIKGGNYLESLSSAETVVFDKTGTLTDGSFEIKEIVAERGYTEEQVVELAAYAENYSSHPLAAAIGRAYGKEADASKIHELNEIAGRGVTAEIELSGKTVAVAAGNARLMKEIGVESVAEEKRTAVYIAADGAPVGRIAFADKIKEGVAETIGELKRLGVKNTVMLSGDREEAAQGVAEAVGIDSVYAQLLPQDKVAHMEELLEKKSGAGKAVVYVGDGINDAPVLARADVGVAMGGMGSDAAIEVADIVIMTDEPSKLAAAIRIAKKTNLIAKQNVVFAIGVKAAVLALAALGLANMWLAVFADVGVAVLAILNSIRAMHI